eukprot:8680694-Ditylum_brightwellii.AAC.1
MEKCSTDLRKQSPILAIKSALCSNIGSERALLTDIIPNLSLLLGDLQKTSTNDQSASMGYETARNRFNFLLRQFVRSFCEEKTIVLFLDDLQWADAASMELLENLILDRNNPGLLIIGSYRDDEVHDKNHPLTRCLHGINAQNNGIISSIPLQNLELKAINGYLADLLNATADKTIGLAEIVHKKTHGNIFS